MAKSEPTNTKVFVSSRQKKISYSKCKILKQSTMLFDCRDYFDQKCFNAVSLEK